MSRLLIASALVLASSLPGFAEPPKPPSVPVQPNRAFPDLTRIYQFTGVRDDGSASNVGIATSLYCTNFASTTIQIQYIIRNEVGIQKANPIYYLQAKFTHSTSTHNTTISAEDANFNTGILNGGSVVVLATHPEVLCTAMVVDASSAASFAIQLHGRRYAPHPDSQE